MDTQWLRLQRLADRRREYRRQRADARAAASDHQAHIDLEEQAMADLNDAIAGLADRIEWAGGIRPQPVPIGIGEAETGLAHVPGVVLLKPSGRAGRTGWVETDRGSVYCTDRRMVLSGSQGVVEFSYQSLGTVSRIPEGLMVTTTEDATGCVLAGPADRLEATLRWTRSYQPGVELVAPLRALRTEYQGFLEGHRAALTALEASQTRP